MVDKIKVTSFNFIYYDNQWEHTKAVNFSLWEKYGNILSHFKWKKEKAGIRFKNSKTNEVYFETSFDRLITYSAQRHWIQFDTAGFQSSWNIDPMKDKNYAIDLVEFYDENGSYSINLENKILEFNPKYDALKPYDEVVPKPKD
ncbi:hypothetical protein JM47_02060 [Ureaplasma diversum]|uniref:Uncharacterized protein n=1 Tax=Ureaplasma diversum TaxID=42094 RepID=A0A0C5RPS5_9BACT|nr:hypothetical protein [Ureaplasma diversum]AJQ45369.1 hypothetical protein JM47_02060 [Ureaplasma diversum]